MMGPMRILLIGGLKHCGKSSLGRIVARENGLAFYDLDDLVLGETGGAWTTVRQLYRDLGRLEFLSLEEDAARTFVEWAIPRLEGDGAVLALGGGTVENPGAVAWLRHAGTRVYVRAEAELLYRRIMAGGRPPFLSEDDPHGDFLELYARRDALWREFADLVHDVDDSPKDINARRLQVALEKHHAR